jgi:hypothetical protein
VEMAHGQAEVRPKPTGRHHANHQRGANDDFPAIEDVGESTPS